MLLKEDDPEQAIENQQMPCRHGKRENGTLWERKTYCKGGLEMTEKERMLAGKLYCPFKVGDNTWEKSREVLEKFNSMPWHQEKERMQLLREIFGHLEEDAVIVPPFYCDKGTQIYIGKHFMQTQDCSSWTRRM